MPVVGDEVENLDLPLRWKKIADKLDHPLQEIRLRAIKNIEFKVKSGLLSISQLLLLPKLLDTLLRSVRLDDPPNALYFLQYLIQKEPSVISILVKVGAIPYLQSMNKSANAELQPIFSQVVESLLTSPALTNQEVFIQRRKQLPTPPIPREKTASDETSERPSAGPCERPVLDRSPLSSNGWKFPDVTLTTPDDEFLFEFEVKLRMRSDVDEVIHYCRCFKERLLSDFPVQVFLQRPEIVKHLLNILQLPLEDLKNPKQTSVAAYQTLQQTCTATFGEHYYHYKPKNKCIDLFFIVFDTLQTLVMKFESSLATYFDPQYHIQPLMLDGDGENIDQSELHEHYGLQNPAVMAYPPVPWSKSTYPTKWSVSGTLYNVIYSILPLLKSQYHPLIPLASFLQRLIIHLLEPILQQKSKGKPARAVEASAQAASLNAKRYSKCLEALVSVVDHHNIYRSIKQSLSSTDEAGVHETPSVLYLKLVDIIIAFATACPPEAYVTKEPRPEVVAMADRIYLPERILRELEDLAADEGIFSVDPTIRTRLLPVIEIWRPELFEKFKQRNDFIEKLQQTQIFCEKMMEMDDVQQLDNETSIELSSLCSQTLAVLGILPVELVPDAKSFVHSIVKYIFINSASSTDDAREVYIALLCTSNIRKQQWIFEELQEVLKSQDSSSRQEHINAFLSRIIMHPQSLRIYCSWVLENPGPLIPSDRSSLMQWDFLHGIVIPTLKKELENAGAAAEYAGLVPYFQQLAYCNPVEETEGNAIDMVRTELTQLLYEVDAQLSMRERLLSMIRCLFHETNAIREAGLQGLLSILAPNNTTDPERMSERQTLSSMLRVHEADIILQDPLGSDMELLSTILMHQDVPRRQRQEKEPRADVVYHDQDRYHTQNQNRLVEMIISDSFDISIRQKALEQLINAIDSPSTSNLFFQIPFSKIGALLDRMQDHLSRGEAASLHEIALKCFLTLLNQTAYEATVQKSLAFRQHLRQPHYLLSFVRFLFHPNIHYRKIVYAILYCVGFALENWIAPELLPSCLKVRPTSTVLFPAFLHQYGASTRTSFGFYSSLAKANPSFEVISSVHDQMKPTQVQNSDMDAYQENTLIQNFVSLNFATQGGERDESWQVVANLKNFFSPVFIISCIQTGVRRSKSHRSFLNHMYALKCLCYPKSRYYQAIVNAASGASADASTWFTLFERFITQFPTSLRDEKVLVAILGFFDAIVDGLPLGLLLKVGLFIKSHFIKLLSYEPYEEMDLDGEMSEKKRSKGQDFPMHRNLRYHILHLVLHLLQRASISGNLPLFQSLACGTKLVEILTYLYIPLESEDTYLQAISLRILTLAATQQLHIYEQRRFTDAIESADVEPFSEGSLFIKTLELEALLPHLLILLSKHYLPYTFQDKEVVMRSSECFYAVLRSIVASTNKSNTSIRESLWQNPQTPVLGNRSADAFAWCRRVVLDRDARVRSCSFGILTQLIEYFCTTETPVEDVSMEFWNTNFQMIPSIALKVVLDPCECSSVQASALNVLIVCVRLFCASSPYLQTVFIAATDDQASDEADAMISLVGDDNIFDAVHQLWQTKSKADKLSSQFVNGFLQLLQIGIQASVESVRDICSRLMTTSTMYRTLAKIAFPGYFRTTMQEECERISSISLEPMNPTPSGVIASNNAFQMSLQVVWNSRYEDFVDLTCRRVLMVIESQMQSSSQTLYFYVHNTNLLLNLIQTLEERDLRTFVLSGDQLLENESSHASYQYLVEQILRVWSNIIVYHDQMQKQTESSSTPCFGMPSFAATSPLIHWKLVTCLIHLTSSKQSTRVRLAACPLISSISSSSAWKIHVFADTSALGELFRQLIDLLHQVHESRPSVEVIEIVANAIGCVYENQLQSEEETNTLEAIVADCGLLSFCCHELRSCHGIRRLEQAQELTHAKFCGSSDLEKFRRSMSLMQIWMKLCCGFFYNSRMLQQLAAEQYRFTSLLAEILSQIRYPPSNTLDPIGARQMIQFTLQVILNYIYQNNHTKQSLVKTTLAMQPTSSTSVLYWLWDFVYRKTCGKWASTNRQKPNEIQHAEGIDLQVVKCGFAVLQSAAIHSECRNELLKFGAITSAFEALVHLKQFNKVDLQQCYHLLVFLAAMSKQSNANLVMLQQKSIKYIILDLLQHSDRSMRDIGVLFLRYLISSKKAKSALLQWPEVLKWILEQVYNTKHVNIFYQVSWVLWVFVYDHQKGRQWLLTEIEDYSVNLMELTELIDSKERTFNPCPQENLQVALRNLRTVHHLLTYDSTSQGKPRERMSPLGDQTNLVHT